MPRGLHRTVKGCSHWKARMRYVKRERGEGINFSFSFNIFYRVLEFFSLFFFVLSISIFVVSSTAVPLPYLRSHLPRSKLPDVTRPQRQTLLLAESSGPWWPNTRSPRLRHPPRSSHHTGILSSYIINRWANLVVRRYFERDSTFT